MQLTIDALTVTIAGRDLVDDVTIHAEDGHVIGLVGPNGSGKSTTLRCVYRALRPTSGAVLIGDVDAWQASAREYARAVAALPQDHHAEFDFTVSEVVAMGRVPHQRPFASESDADRDICAAALHDVDAVHLADRSFLTLSGGERQRALVARALAQQPRLLVFDEPTNHLDIRHQIEMLSLVRKTQVTALVALHDLNLAASTCERVYLLDGGRVVAGGRPADVLTPQTVADVFGVHAYVIEHPVSGSPQLIYGDPIPRKGTS